MHYWPIFNNETGDPLRECSNGRVRTALAREVAARARDHRVPEARVPARDRVCP